MSISLRNLIEAIDALTPEQKEQKPIFQTMPSGHLLLQLDDENGVPSWFKWDPTRGGWIPFTL